MFTQKMDMAASYKPVMMLALLDAINDRGRAQVIEVAASFREFYAARKRVGLTVERESATMSRVHELDDSEVQQVMLRMPFEKFERRKFLEYDPRDLAFVRFTPVLWRQIKPNDLAGLRDICQQSIDKYYERLE